MIILAGQKIDKCLTDVERHLALKKVPYVWFNQHQLLSTFVDWRWENGHIDGAMKTNGVTIDLARVRGIYSRLDRVEDLEFSGRSPTAGEREIMHKQQMAFYRWTELTPVRMISRNGPHGSNESKPFQLQLIARHGFTVPETLITNDPAEVRAFHRRHQKVVYKGINNLRSVAQLLDDQSLDRLELLKNCPSQFQQCIEGDDIRVHVVGNETFATRVEAETTDYRYTRRENKPEPTLSEFVLPNDIATRCISLVRKLGLEFAGVDFKLAKNGEYFCLEVNTMPGYEYFQMKEDREIAEALARLLASGWN